MRKKERSRNECTRKHKGKRKHEEAGGSVRKHEEVQGSTRTHKEA